MTQPFRPFVPSAAPSPFAAPAAAPGSASASAGSGSDLDAAASGQPGRAGEAAELPTLPLSVEAPAEAEVGAYANTLSTWFTETDVAVDFAVVLPSELVDTDDGEAVLPRARLVSRVRMPPSQARELVDALTAALERYEAQFGALPRRADGPSDLWTV